MLNSLIKYLKQVKDFRGNRGKRYPLWLVLLVVVLGVMSGHQGYRELEYFVRGNQKSLKKVFKPLVERVPSYSTIRRVMKGVDWENLSESCQKWVQENYPLLQELDGLAIDGKSLRSTVKNSGSKQQNFAVIVSLFSCQTGLVLAQEKFENKKGSELGSAQELVRKCGLKGKLITGDALHCNVSTVRQIRESGNHYLITVKKNHLKLYNQIQEVAKTSKPDSIETRKEISHGRKITRRVSVLKNPLGAESPWGDIQSLIQVERWGYRGKKLYRETVYYISSLEQEAEFFLAKIQEHWLIENQVHWVKDIILKEDQMRIQEIGAASNFALINTVVLNLFRSLGFFSITEGRRWLNRDWEKLLALS